MPVLRVAQVRFASGPVPGAAALSIQPGAVTLIVGPNNSGKSLALREIESWCLGAEVDRKVVSDITIDAPKTVAELTELLSEIRVPPPAERQSTADRFFVNTLNFQQDPPMRIHEVPHNVLPEIARGRVEWLRPFICAPLTIRLDGRSRFALVNERESGDLLAAPRNHLVALFSNDELRMKVRALSAEAFGLYFVVDATNIGRLRVRMSDRPPATTTEEQALDDTARRFHASAHPITELGDGVQSYVGLVSALVTLRHRVLLVDEPDAFLHPPLARRLAADLVRLAEDRQASLFIATHSAEVLLGSLETASDPTVVRLTFERGIPTARALDAGTLRQLIRDPLLRSTGTLRALFHRGAVVTESDTDRAFYDEVNRRLADAGSQSLRDVLVLNAQNMQTEERVIAPLRVLGIPAAAIVDLDAIDSRGGQWTGLLRACQVPAAERSRLTDERTWLSSLLDGLSLSPNVARHVKRGGVDALTGPEKVRAERLLSDLASYGLFVVPGGELESWLPELAVTGHGSEWLIQMLTRLGSDPADSAYVAAGAGGVWDFLRTVSTWIDNPARLGTSHLPPD